MSQDSGEQTFVHHIQPSTQIDFPEEKKRKKEKKKKKKKKGENFDCPYIIVIWREREMMSAK